MGLALHYPWVYGNVAAKSMAAWTTKGPFHSRPTKLAMTTLTAAAGLGGAHGSSAGGEEGYWKRSNGSIIAERKRWEITVRMGSGRSWERL